MTTRHIRDLQRELTTVAEPFGAKLINIRLANSGHLHADDRMRRQALSCLYRSHAE
jgi:hypothetical protein